MRRIMWMIIFLMACGDAENTDQNNNKGTNNTSNNGTNNNSNNVRTNNQRSSNNGTTNNQSTSNNGTTNNQKDYSALVINEIVAAGEPDDWFEIYNSGAVEIDLSGIGYTDDLNEKRKAVLTGSLAPKTYLKIVVSDETAGFKLGRDEEIALFAPDETMLDHVDWDEGDSPTGKSFGRFPNGTGEFKTLNDPTPGAANIDNDPNAPVCGDMKKEGDEICDTPEFGDKDCITEGFASGALLCASDCLSVITTGCISAANSISINEVNSSGDDQIEIYNSGPNPIDIGGWYVVDDGYSSAADVDHRYDFPAGTMIQSQSFLVLTKDVEHTFGIGGDDTITLYDASDTVVDQVTWPDGDAKDSWCRATDGNGTFQVCTASFGSTNTP